MEKQTILTPLIIEKCRARYRLVGSIFLVLVLAITLPISMDSSLSPRYKIYPIQFTFNSSRNGNRGNITLTNVSKSLILNKFNTSTSKVVASSGSFDVSLRSRTNINELSLGRKKEKPARAVKFLLHFGSFENQIQAEVWKAKLDVLGLQSSLVQENQKFILRSGPYEDRKSAQKAVRRIAFLYRRK